MRALLVVAMLCGADAFDKRCLATDDDGVVLAEAVHDDAFTCRERVKAELAARFCTDTMRRLRYRYQRGRGRAVAAELYCR